MCSWNNYISLKKKKTPNLNTLNCIIYLHGKFEKTEEADFS